jgi:hypothetical protein
MGDWLEWLMVPGVAGALALALAAYLKTRPAMKEAQVHGEAALWAEIGALRAELKRERELCDERIGRMEERHAAEFGAVNAEVQVLRHDRNNVRQALNAMFAMLKQEGFDVAHVVAAIEDMLKNGDEVIAIEKAAMPALKAARGRA